MQRCNLFIERPSYIHNVLQLGKDNYQLDLIHELFHYAIFLVSCTVDTGQYQVDQKKPNTFFRVHNSCIGKHINMCSMFTPIRSKLPYLYILCINSDELHYTNNSNKFDENIQLLYTLAVKEIIKNNGLTGRAAKSWIGTMNSRNCRRNLGRHCDLAQRNFCTILTFSRNHAIRVVERNFRATLATFVSFEAAWINSCEL